MTKNLRNLRSMVNKYDCDAVFVSQNFFALSTHNVVSASIKNFQKVKSGQRSFWYETVEVTWNDSL